MTVYKKKQMKYFWHLLFFIFDKIYIFYLKTNSEEGITFFSRNHFQLKQNFQLTSNRND